MKIEVYLACFLGIIFLVLMMKLFAKPFKALLRVVLNTISGAILIIGINFIGQSLNFSLPVNIYTALIVGSLGIPGLISLFLLKLWLID